MTHTPEPWQQKHDYNLEGAVRIIANVDADIDHTGTHYTYDTVAICHDDFDETLPNAESNARRIVACVNALSGISTEAIEAGGVQELAQLLADCLVRLARLKKHARIDDNAGYGPDGRMLVLSEIEENARAALSKWEASK